MILFHILFVLIVMSTVMISPVVAETIVFDPATAKDLKINGADSKIEDGLFKLSNKPDAAWPGFTLNGRWSLGPRETFVLEIENLDDKPVTVAFRLNSTGANPDKGIRSIAPRTTFVGLEKRRWKIDIPGEMPKQLANKLFGMRAYPGSVRADKDGNVSVSNLFDRHDIVSMTLFIPRPTEQHRIAVRKIVIAQEDGLIASENEALTWPPEKFFPMIDRFGQYKHADWPGKIVSVGQLRGNIAVEDADLATHPGPKDRNPYGGWIKGPKLDATGHFRSEKIDGNWWIVDPEGRLFWSHGTCGVRFHLAVTGIQDREFLFEEFPTESFASTSGALHNYYKGKGRFRTFNFTESNLKLKYGEDWKNRFCERAHTRLRSWGMNTIANWSDPAVYRLRKTPYTITFGTSGIPVIRGSAGHWGQFRDPFSPKFREVYAEAIAKQKEYFDDPWCLGIYVDNELGWGDDQSLAIATLQSPADQPAKIVFVEDLKKRYETIDNLNKAWKTAYADWTALLSSTVAPDRNNAKTDLQCFYERIAEEYFRVIREELKKVAPNKMYLGCRFSNHNDTTVRVAARHCDIVSFNLYRYTLADFKLPEGVDKPVLVGEFHFGALDRGMYHAGLRPVKNQRARAEAYENYARSGLEHPNIVGIHWFLYGDQSPTGRPLDGENFQIGLLDLCDTPYSETINAARQIGEKMFEIRSGKKH